MGKTAKTLSLRSVAVRKDFSRYREYKKDRGSDADELPIKRRVAEIHAYRILKLDRAAKQDEPAPEGAVELSVEEVTV